MDIDFSKVVLLVLAVLPGYLALRGNARIIPRTQRSKGATEETAEFLIYSVAAHCLLASIYCIITVFVGWFYKGDAYFYLRYWFSLTPSGMFNALEKAPLAYSAIYLMFSLYVGRLVGLGRGLIEVWHPVDWIASKSLILNSPMGKFWLSHIERFLITGRPIIYDALFPDVDEAGGQKSVFAELILKNNQGSITGTVAGFSIANDEENHKLIYLKNVYQKSSVESSYQKLDADGVLVDMADAITVQIKQV
jgi:hypothetical protein